MSHGEAEMGGRTAMEVIRLFGGQSLEEGLAHRRENQRQGRDSSGVGEGAATLHLQERAYLTL